MDAKKITEVARRTIEGTISFPEVVGQLMAEGVEYYLVDYVALRKSFYGAGGEVVTTAIPFEGLPKVATDFSVEDLREDIRDSQQKGQSYREFTRRAMQAGVQGYYAFLRGRRVTYLGRQGDQHVELFPI